MAIFDPHHTIFDVHVHVATYYIAIVCLGLQIFSLIGGILRGCSNGNICQICCGGISNIIALIPSGLLLYGNIHQIAWLYWPFLICGVIFIIFAIPWSIFTFIVKSMILCKVCLSAAVGGPPRRDVEETIRLNERGEPIEERRVLNTTLWVIFSFISLIFLLAYAYAITVVNRDHNLLVSGPVYADNSRLN